MLTVSVVAVVDNDVDALVGILTEPVDVNDVPVNVGWDTVPFGV